MKIIIEQKEETKYEGRKQSLSQKKYERKKLTYINIGREEGRKKYLTMKAE